MATFLDEYHTQSGKVGNITLDCLLWNLDGEIFIRTEGVNRFDKNKQPNFDLRIYPYRAPEIQPEKINMSSKTDIYSIGVISYFMLNGLFPE